MKKFTLLLLICLYTISSVGVGISQFYCCGKLKTTSLSFIHANNIKCGKGMQGCCKTTFKSLQVKDTHVAAAVITNPVKPFLDLLFSYADLSVSKVSVADKKLAYADTAPPLHYNVPFYTLHCAYLI